MDQNNRLQEMNEKLKKHMTTLIEQNQNLINEIDNVIENDEKKISILNRKDRINSVLSSNRNFINKSLNNLDVYLNKRNNYGRGSPCNITYEYH